ncbi:MAG: phosphoribosyltransferase-like protein [Pirellulales bacterium]
MSNALTAFCADNLETIEELVARFGDYVTAVGGVSSAHIRRWLSQFKQQHWPLALKFAGLIKYYSQATIGGAMPELKKLLDQQPPIHDADPDEVFFVPLGRVAESGPNVVSLYRNVNHLHGRQQQFVDLTDLPHSLYACAKPAVVFFDDFIGTGKQVSDYWRDILSQLVPDYHPLYLGTVAAFKKGIDRVESETPIKVVTVNCLGPELQLMATGSGRLSTGERKTLRRYCEDWENQPHGYGELAAMVSFCQGTPNNAPSIVRGSERQKPQRGLLPGWGDL